MNPVQLRLPGSLSDLPMKTTFTPENERLQQWRQVGWWDLRTFELHGMDADHTDEPGVAPLWIMAIDDDLGAADP